MATRLDWLVRDGDLPLLTDSAVPSAHDLARDLQMLAHHDLTFSQVLKLDRRLQKLAGASGGRLPGPEPLRIAVIGSATLDHLLPALRVVGIRHGYQIDILLGDYGQYLNDILDRQSALHAFAPDVVLIALDADHCIGAAGIVEGPDGLAQTFAGLREAWRILTDELGAHVIHQTVLPRAAALLGSNEHRLAGTPASRIQAFNTWLRVEADAASVDLLAIDAQTGQDGLAAWHDPVLWLKARQEISPLAAQHYAELALRLMSARRGRSAKCLVLDLDNTLWGGVIGDDGLDGIAIGQGSPEGEAFLGFQRYVLSLMERGVILAVCSKNDEANARAAFERHPDMLLRSEHITAFLANWDDKPTNLRRIADQIGIGLDALVFVDDNPFERELVRQTLPMVRVPEMPEDAALYADRLASAGYFEAVALTSEDAARTRLYAANAARARLRDEATDLAGYLASLDMVLEWQRVDRSGLARATQLANKTNQFNLTTRRYSEAEMAAMIVDPAACALQFRLCDRYGDNGVIALIVAVPAQAPATLEIDAWLMSCRVLGRDVERACLAVLVAEAAAAGVTELQGVFRPTARNDMVRGHYARLGFTAVYEGDDETRWRLSTATPVAAPGVIRVVPKVAAGG